MSNLGPWWLDCLTPENSPIVAEARYMQWILLKRSGHGHRKTCFNPNQNQSYDKQCRIPCRFMISSHQLQVSPSHSFKWSVIIRSKNPSGNHKVTRGAERAERKNCSGKWSDKITPQKPLDPLGDHNTPVGGPLRMNCFTPPWGDDSSPVFLYLSMSMAEQMMVDRWW